jgi:hypothetical protein
MTVTQDVNWSTTGGASGNVTQTLKGKVDFGGAFNDFIDANIKETVGWSSLGTSGAQVTVTLDGTINTSTQNYSYANESVQITAGVLVADDSKP